MVTRGRDVIRTPETVDDWLSADQCLMLLLPHKASYNAFPADPIGDLHRTPGEALRRLAQLVA